MVIILNTQGILTITTIYKDSYSDYTDDESCGLFRSFTLVGDRKSMGKESIPAVTGIDSVMESKSLDVLLVKNASSGLQEEPDPTSNPTLDSLADQLYKCFHRYVTPSEIKCLQEG